MSRLRLVLADDHVLMRAGLRGLLEAIPGVEIVGEASDGFEAVSMVAKHRPHIALLDVAMAGLNGLDAAVRILDESPGTRVIILSMYANEEYVCRAMKIGVSGYLPKSAEPAELRTAIETVARGEVFLSPPLSKLIVAAYVRGESSNTSALARLSPRQREVLQLMSEGRRTKEIAQILKISARTVESHRAKLMAELHIHDVPSLVKFAMRIGLVTCD